MLSALVILIISPAVRATDNRVISLSVDGVRRGFSTDADTVADVLARAKVRLEDEDLVEPALDTSINTQIFYINVYRAKPAIVVDGEREIRVVTPFQNPKLIAERSAGLKLFPEDGFDSELIRDFANTNTIGHRITVKRAVPVNVKVDGRTLELRSLKPNVGEMLREKGIVVDEEDIVVPKRSMPLVAGMKIRVTRVGKEVIAVEETIAAPIETIFDNNKPAGYEEIRSPGADGKKLVTYKVRSESGVEVSRKVLQEVILVTPKPRVVVRGVSATGDVWYQLRLCESGNDYGKNTGNGFYGAYQFDYSTWQSNAAAEWAGSYPHQAPANVQDAAAQNLQSRRGWGPWPACARKLGLL